MALGGGTFISQNKTLPGSYMNFVSAESASQEISDRGVVTMPLDIGWGASDEMFEVTAEEFQKNSMAYFGYAYSSDEMKGLRDLFKHAKSGYFYRLASGGVKATCAFGTAKYSGARGNDLKVVIQTNADDETKFDCITYLGSTKVDSQTVGSASDLVDNDYVDFDQDATIVLTAATYFTGGTDGEVDGAAYQTYLDKAEGYSYNTMGVVTTDDTVKALFAAYNERMRDEMGKKFQLVVYDYSSADYMGVISVKNKTKDDGWSEASSVYWVTGAEAGCAINKSLQNTAYDGEFDIDVDYTQSELTTAIQSGEFVFHNVSGTVRVLDDINTMVTTTDDCGEIFKDNQTIRVIDQIGNDIASLFATKYLGAVQNDEAGRLSLWSDIVSFCNDLLTIRAIENFEDSDITVAQGTSKKAVVVTMAITVVNAMSKLYMTVTVS